MFVSDHPGPGSTRLTESRCFTGRLSTFRNPTFNLKPIHSKPYNICYGAFATCLPDYSNCFLKPPDQDTCSSKQKGAIQMHVEAPAGMGAWRTAGHQWIKAHPLPLLVVCGSTRRVSSTAPKWINRTVWPSRFACS